MRIWFCAFLAHNSSNKEATELSRKGSKFLRGTKLGTFMGRLNIVVFDDMHRDCNGSFKRTGRDKNLEVTTTEVSRLSWLWMIYFCFLTPQVFTFGRSLRMIYFKVILAEQLYIFSSPAVYKKKSTKHGVFVLIHRRRRGRGSGQRSWSPLSSRRCTLSAFPCSPLWPCRVWTPSRLPC